jgi:hypothetical protein
VINHPEFECYAFGGNVKIEGELIHVKSLDSFRKRVYLAFYGLWLTLDAGMEEEVNLNSSEIPGPNPGRIPKAAMEQRGVFNQ